MRILVAFKSTIDFFYFRAIVKAFPFGTFLSALIKSIWAKTQL